MDMQDAFETFYDKIELPALSEERMGRAWARLHEHLTTEYGLRDEAVFIQGSWANGTAVRPEPGSGGEYDVDIVAVCCETGADAREAIADLREVLSRNRDIEARIEPDERGRPCVRLRYADDPDQTGFHVDIVPSRPAQGLPPLEVPVGGQEDWRETDPLAFTQWCLDRGEPFRRIVRELKRWRDCNDVEIKSIVLQVLAGQAFPAVASTDAERVAVTLTRIRERLAGYDSSPPTIENPVLSAENLADRWLEADYKAFRAALDEAIADVRAARAAETEEASCKAWQQVFGSDFPDPQAARRKPPVVPPPPPPAPKPRSDRGRRYG